VARGTPVVCALLQSGCDASGGNPFRRNGRKKRLGVAVTGLSRAGYRPFSLVTNVSLGPLLAYSGLDGNRRDRWIERAIAEQL
jgi:hypothetical protein